LVLWHALFAMMKNSKPSLDHDAEKHQKRSLNSEAEEKSLDVPEQNILVHTSGLLFINILAHRYRNKYAILE
jgi:hypothetical protein